MANNKILKFCMMLLIVVFSFSFISANYVISNPQYTQFGSSVPSTVLRGQQEMCGAGQDFILQIAPFGCTPAVVRSDLLAEQNVPVFCQIAATKLNPMIDVEAINNIDISGQRAKGVSGFGFHPARSALGGREDIGMPLLNNIGYAVIVLEKQKNSSALPDFVEGTLDARIKYDLKNAFGIGKATFYLPDFENDEDWENSKEQYSFWNGKASLKADSITDEGATVSVYTDTRRISSASLEKGKTSNDIYLPGFDCWGALNLRLDGLEVPGTKIRLQINDDLIEVKEGEAFLENRCSVRNVDKRGLVQIIDVNCKEDEKVETYTLSISPKVKLDFEGAKPEGYEAGDFLYEYEFTYKEGLDKYLVPAQEGFKILYDDSKKALSKVGSEVSKLGVELANLAKAQTADRANQVIKGIDESQFNTDPGVRLLIRDISGGLATVGQELDYQLGRLDSVWTFINSQGELYQSYNLDPNIGEAYGQSIKMFEGDINDLKKDVETLGKIIAQPAPKTDTPTVEAYIDGINKGLKELEGNVDALNQKGNSLKSDIEAKTNKFLGQKIIGYTYLGYIGTEGDTDKQEDLYVRVVGSPYKVDRLTEDMLSEVARFDSARLDAQKGSRLRRELASFSLTVSVYLERFAKYIWKGSTISDEIYLNTETDISGKKITLKGFTSPIDLKLSDDEQVYYEKAKKDYEQIINYFASEKYPNNEEPKTLGEIALFEFIMASYNANQKQTVLELCGQFKEKYPDSVDELNFYCKDNINLANSKISSTSVLINGEVQEISFKKIVEPSFEEYGVELLIENAGAYSGWQPLKNGATLLLSPTEFIRLKDLDEDYALFEVNVDESTLREAAWSQTDLRLKLNEIQFIGSRNYKITLDKINIKKVAKVSVLPKIDNVETHANFSFKIGIEDRSIKLSPEKTKEKIANLDESIKDWEDKSEALGNVVKGMKGACLATGAFLTVKNFISNLDGKSIARQNVMRGDKGWYEKCKDLSTTSSDEYKGYKDVDECLVEEASAIEKDVETYAKGLKEHNDYFKKMQDDPAVTSTKTFLGVGDKYVNDDALKEKILNDPSFKSRIESCLSDKFSNGIIYDKNKDAIPVHDFMTNYLPKVSVPELKDLSLGCYVGGSSTLNEMSSANLKSVVTDVYIDEKEQVSKQAQIDAMKNNPSLKNVGYSVVKDKDSLEVIYEGGEVNGDYKLIEEDSLVQKVNYKGETFMVKLKKEISNGIRAVDEVYSEDGSSLFTIADTSPKGIIANEVKTKFVFKSFDEKSYQNPYAEGSYEVTYYETDPYKGLPAIVPFDVKNGWYAYMKQTLPIFGNMASYTESGRVMSMRVCNIGPDKKQEDGKGDDICEIVNLGTGQAYNVFPGLDSSKAKEIIDCAVSAVEQASKAHKSGANKPIRINTKCGGSIDIKVGKPAVDIPEMQCQDFMSVKDCQILFNVCDPVICPSSRCDFGGAYPVQDVIQSGIIGSIALCLPNFNANPMKGTVIPVCLSGIKAGLDGYLSILTAHRDCLQESLDTGEMVGICDEIYSIYLCDFFWKQGLPLAKIAIPKVLEWALGQNVHGGGEYLGVKSAWESAGNSVSYFTQYYAANSFKAFKARTAEDVGDEVCKSYASAVYPEGGDLLGSLTDPDSPPQFHGRFDEIPFTTATNPPNSQYKVYYHIYAGKDSRAYYSVFLQGGSGSSYYFDTSSRRVVDSGYISKGDYASETVDFIAPSGYKELCIRVNEQEECGFKEASTSFAVDYITDQYVKEQASKTDVTTEKECVSGSPSLYNLATLNAQGAAESAINPAIYSQGIIRICATDNPGKGSDGKAGMVGSRWVEAGYCGDKKMKCWLDTQSVKDAVEFNTTSTEALETVNENYQNILTSSEGYLTDDAFRSKLKEMEGVTPEKKITLINAIIDKVIYYNQKAKLLLERAGAYVKLIPAKKAPEETTCARSGGVCAESCLTENLIIAQYDECDLDDEVCCKVASVEKPKEKEEIIPGDRSSEAESLRTTLRWNRPKTEVIQAVSKAGYNNCEKYINMLYDSTGSYKFENEFPDPLLLIALMQQESECRSNNVVSPSGCVGLMQICSWGLCKPEMGINGISDLKGEGSSLKNVQCGAIILWKYYKDYSESGLSFEGCNKKVKYYGWEAALRAYNGRGCNKAYPNQDDFVEEVLKKYNKLLENYEGEQVSVGAVENIQIVDFKMSVVGTDLKSGQTINIRGEADVEEAGFSMEGGIINIENGANVEDVGNSMEGGIINIENGANVEDVGNMMQKGIININRGAKVKSVGIEMEGGTININEGATVSYVGINMKNGKINVEKGAEIGTCGVINDENDFKNCEVIDSNDKANGYILFLEKAGDFGEQTGECFSGKAEWVDRTGNTIIEETVPGKAYIKFGIKSFNDCYGDYIKINSIYDEHIEGSSETKILLDKTHLNAPYDDNKNYLIDCDVELIKTGSFVRTWATYAPNVYKFELYNSDDKVIFESKPLLVDKWYAMGRVGT